jgi:hypothetical protein
MCQVEHAKDGTPSKWWENPKNLIIRKRGLKESQTNGFYTVETAGGSSTTYEVNCTTSCTLLDFISSLPTRQKAITWDVWAISVPAKRVDSASYSRGPGKAEQLALHAIEMSK